MTDIALKIDVDTLRGTHEGVPNLLAALARAATRASFYFSLGPDHTGWALRRVFRRGFLGKAVRTSVLSHYGLRTLLYGVLLPGPDIARRALEPMRAVARAGHETGIHCHDHVYWQDNVAGRDGPWTTRQLDRAAQAYTRVFDSAPRAHAAAGWQVNGHLFAWEDAHALDYASDTRGSTPFLPVMDGYAGRCPQLPTTLPTLDELIGRDGMGEREAIDLLLERTARPDEQHVYTLHAELEGQRLLAGFERLLATWRARGHRLGTLAELARSLDRARLPRHQVVLGAIEGRSGRLALQGEPA